MTITLTPAMEAILQLELKSGRFSGPEEIVQKALDLFTDIHPIEVDDLERVVKEGDDSFENEKTYSGEEARAYIKAMRARL